MTYKEMDKQFTANKIYHKIHIGDNYGKLDVNLYVYTDKLELNFYRCLSGNEFQGLYNDVRFLLAKLGVMKGV